MNGPAKIAVRVREGSIIKVLAVEPKTYDYLISKEGENKDVMEKCMYIKHYILLFEFYLNLFDLISTQNN